jgi:hypothetical protein
MRYIFGIFIVFSFFSCKTKNEKDSNTANNQPSIATINISPEILAITDTALSEYYALNEADTSNIDIVAKKLAGFLAEYQPIISEDSSLSESMTNSIISLQLNADSIYLKNDLISKRRSFSAISDTLFSLVKNLQYSGRTIYRQVCPMAFNDSEKAHWLSQNSEIENPYLGKKHPKYGAGMLHCGELIDSVNYRR